MDRDAVSIRALSKSYPEGIDRRTVLNRVDADFEAGLMHAVVGRSGSGKSTLLNLVAGVDQPDSGTIRVNGQDMTAMDERSRTEFRRENIGIVFQFFNLIESLTVAENVMLPLELNKQAHREERTREVLHQVGLGDRGESFPATLSGGQQQRVAIARAIVHRPSIIVADEPTGNLDEISAREVISTLAQVHGQSTVIVVTHSVELAEKCSRQWLLRGGEITMS